MAGYIDVHSLIYIEVESIQFDINNNAIILTSHWTPPLANLGSSKVPTYINFRPNPFQVTTKQASLVTDNIGAQVENFFSQFSYKMHQEPDPADPTKKAYVLELFNI
jgi:hypothetical protein